MKQKCVLLDSMVGSALNYASEIWGFDRANDVEIIFKRFCRNVLRLDRNVPTSFYMANLATCQCVFYVNIELSNIS